MPKVREFLTKQEIGKRRLAHCIGGTRGELGNAPGYRIAEMAHIGSKTFYNRLNDDFGKFKLSELQGLGAAGIITPEDAAVILCCTEKNK